MAEGDRDERYLEVLLHPLRVCIAYQPMFGHGKKGGLTLAEFQTMYRGDPFYSWIGLDSPLMYAAHKAAGGMTSIYRQIGIGSQRLFHHVVRDGLGLSAEHAAWSYPIAKGTKVQTLTLDGRVDVRHIRDDAAKARVVAWLEAAKARASVAREMAPHITGAVFEVRQGYKSKDSKRQNADIANAVNAYQNFYLPVVLLLSTQIDDGVAERYQVEKWLLLTGTTGGTATDSTFVFCREILGYDLAGFFERNSARIRREVESVLAAILTP